MFQKCKIVFSAKYFPYLIFNMFSMMHFSKLILSNFYNNCIIGSHWQVAKVCCFQNVSRMEWSSVEHIGDWNELVNWKLSGKRELNEYLLSSKRDSNSFSASYEYLCCFCDKLAIPSLVLYQQKSFLWEHINEGLTWGALQWRWVDFFCVLQHHGQTV